MEGRNFELSKPDFEHLDKFLSTVEPIVGRNYEFPIPGFSYGHPNLLLKHLGFELVCVNLDHNRVYFFDNNPARNPTAIFIVPSSVEPSKQWTILLRYSDAIWMQWKGPAKESNGIQVITNHEPTKWMEGSRFNLASEDFRNLDKFLSSVTPTIAESYEYTGSQFLRYDEKTVFMALGFRYLYLKQGKTPKYRYDGRPTCPLAQFIVPAGEEISDQWTVLAKTETLMFLTWNGPTKEAEIKLMTAEEARQIADKVHETTEEELQVILQKIHHEAQLGNYCLHVPECPKLIQERLLDLGFKIVSPVISWGGE